MIMKTAFRDPVCEFLLLHQTRCNLKWAGLCLCDLVKLRYFYSVCSIILIIIRKCAPINTMHLQGMLLVEVITLSVHEVDLQQ